MNILTLYIAVFLHVFCTCCFQRSDLSADYSNLTEAVLGSPVSNDFSLLARNHKPRHRHKQHHNSGSNSKKKGKNSKKKKTGLSKKFYKKAKIRKGLSKKERKKLKKEKRKANRVKPKPKGKKQKVNHKKVGKKDLKATKSRTTKKQQKRLKGHFRIPQGKGKKDKVQQTLKNREVMGKNNKADAVKAIQQHVKHKSTIAIKGVRYENNKAVPCIHYYNPTSRQVVTARRDGHFWTSHPVSKAQGSKLIHGGYTGVKPKS